MANLAFCLSMMIDVVDGKCSGDWLPWKELCEHYYPDASDPEVIAAYLDSLAADVDHRQALITRIREDYEAAYAAAARAGQAPPPDPFPDGAKISPELVDRYPELRPRTLVFEEVQTIFTEWPKAAKEARARCEKALTTIAKKGRSVGVSIWVVTQQVNADTLPTSISNNLGIRVCLSVESFNEAINASGLTAYNKGLDASQLTKADKGIAVISGGAVGDPSMVKTHYVVPVLRDVVAAATRLRTEAGTLPTVDDTTPEVSFPERAAEVWPGNARRQAFSELAPLFAARWPVECSGWDVDQVSAAATAAELTTVQVARTIDGKKTSLRGLARDEVMEAAAADIAARANGDHIDD
jgi:S-DNA-T family DNA segregation ATPase FtsK/SpoIIIE